MSKASRERWEARKKELKAEREKLPFNGPGPRVVNCLNERCEEYVGSPSIWSNPYGVKRRSAPFHVADQTAANEAYRRYILKTPKLLRRLESLRGKVLGCWCAPKPCHADILLELANRPPKPRSAR